MEIEIVDEQSIVDARKRGRDMARRLGFRTVDAAQIATAISELARNIFLYADGGAIAIAAINPSEERWGIVVMAHDTGPGVEDTDLVMQDGFSTGDGLGLGLPGTKRIVDEFEIRSAKGKGTVVRVVKWLHR